MSNLVTTKSMLAKLLATENITVEHRNVPTAYFDLKNRTMILPIWKDMDGDLYDLLTGHEVGHALDTPAAGWHDAVKGNKELKKFHTFLNVIEDARIERKNKLRYPGLAKSFSRAYKSLHDRDFFGLSKVADVNKLNLIDRINIRFKLGDHVAVSFSDEERSFVKEIEDAASWEQVVDIAKRVYAYVESNEQDKINTMDDFYNAQMEDDQGDDEDQQGDYDYSDDQSDGHSDFDADDSDFSDEGEESDSESSDGEDSDSADGNGNDDSSESDLDDNSGEDSDYINTGEAGSENDDSDGPISITDKIFRDREHELVNESGMVSVLTLPDAILQNIIVPSSVVLNKFESGINENLCDSIYGRVGMSYQAVAEKCVRKFNINNKKFITHMLKEFEMRKKASQYARTQTARTGELNMNVLHKYKYNSDLFKKISVVGKGKNHGMILFLDMSGSMEGIFGKTIEQLMVLVSFCKMANIPFDVYGFNDSTSIEYDGFDVRDVNIKKFINNSHNLQISGYGFNMPHLISSTMNKTQYRRAFNMMAILHNEYRNACEDDCGVFPYQTWRDAGFCLNGTPFVQTLLASRDIITSFKNANALDVVNVIYLTDGVGSNGLNVVGENAYEINSGSVYLVDKKTKKRIRLHDKVGYGSTQNDVTQLVREVTGCKHIGFYVGSKRDIVSCFATTIFPSAEVQQDAKRCMNNNNFFAAKVLGYDKYFYMIIDNDSVKEQNLYIDPNTMTKGKMVKQFSNNQASKRNSRLMISKFAEEISF